MRIALVPAWITIALRDAAGPDTTIVGMNYYNPYLASWLEGDAGQQLAVESAQAVAVVTDYLETTYATAGIPVADVATAFESDDFVNMAPAPNEFTYMCAADPVGPDIHANDAGYALIAETIASVLP